MDVISCRCCGDTGAANYGKYGKLCLLCARELIGGVIPSYRDITDSGKCQKGIIRRNNEPGHNQLARDNDYDEWGD